VASKSPQDHLAHLRQLFQQLSDHGLVINPSKCQFGRAHLDFLGHRIDRTGASPLPEKVKAVQNFPLPVNTKDLRRFMGMVNFYHRFIPAAATLMAPLCRVLSGGKNTLID